MKKDNNKVKNNPLFSVVVPTYNSEKYILKTLETVFNQTYDNFELIISDDGSNDNTVETVNKYFDCRKNFNNQILTNRHEGPGATRNQGIRKASGSWISFLDSDDKWFPQKLEVVAQYIENNKKVNFICHSEIWQNGHKNSLVEYYTLFDYKIHPFLSLFRQNAFSTSAVVVKRELLLNTDLFDDTLPVAQDYDLWLRVALLPEINIGFIKEPLGYYITREGNISSNIAKRLQCSLKIGEKHFKSLKRVCKFSYIEKLKYESVAYTSAGLGFLRKKDLKRGMMLFLLGILRWPFRVDLLIKTIRFKTNVNLNN